MLYMIFRKMERKAEKATAQDSDCFLSLVVVLDSRTLLLEWPEVVSEEV